MCPWESCGARCYNCATLDKKQCRCLCADGWKGNDCRDQVCKDDARCRRWFPDPARDYTASCTGKKKRLCLKACTECVNGTTVRDDDASDDKCPPVLGPAVNATRGGGDTAPAVNYVGVTAMSAVATVVTSCLSQ